MCNKCMRYRNFEGSANRGQIDLLCLKKFHILEMVRIAKDTCTRVQENIDKRTDQLKEEELRHLQQYEDSAEIVNKLKELRTQQY